MGYPVVHFEVLGKGASGLETFYREAFGCVEVADLSATLDRITALGGRRVMGPVDVPAGSSMAIRGSGRARRRSRQSHLRPARRIMKPTFATAARCDRGAHRPHRVVHLVRAGARCRRSRGSRGQEVPPLRVPRA